MTRLARILRVLPMNNYDRRQLYLKLRRLAAVLRTIARHIGF